MGTGWSFIKPDLSPELASSRRMAIWPQADARAETADVFIYDRIETAQDHRRKGLGVAVMIALGTARKSLVSPQLLVATGDGRKLYANLGWTVLAPFAAATIL